MLSDPYSSPDLVRIQYATHHKDPLKDFATRASKLAVAERILADQQHMVALDLKVLADELTDQVTAVETENRLGQVA